MVPSSFMISQMTPEGSSPARRERSTEASVCPARTSTPPSRARRGKDVAGPREVAGPRAGLDRGQDGARAVGCGNAGGHALARIDGFAEGGAEVGGVVRRHQGQAESVAALAGQREADQAAAEGGHEIDDFGRHLFGGDGQVAFVLAILVVDDDQHAPGASFLDSLGNGREWHNLVSEFPLYRWAQGSTGGR